MIIINKIMEKENLNNESQNKKQISNWQIFANILLFVVLILFVSFYSLEPKQKQISNSSSSSKIQKTEDLLLEDVLPKNGLVLPIKWNDLGKKMIAAGVIDSQKFESLYAGRGGISEETKKLLYDKDNGNLVINDDNNGIILNLLWAFGLSNKNQILEQGPMVDPKYGGDASRFASTGGWTLAQGNVMNHYSAHQFLVLTPEEQAKVERVSKNIYRPCCNNSTYFPDCNHGMAMLGLLELLAAQGVPEDEMYKIALRVNSYWFPDTYLTLAKYFNSKGIEWKNVDPKEVLDFNFSSASGFQKVLTQIQPVERQSGGSCGV